MFGSFRDLAFLGAAAGGGVATPLLLDLYPGAAVAYSLRNLSTAYTGPVVRVRRSSDNTEQDFTAAQVTDGTLTTFCGAGNGIMRTWYDQSGNNRNSSFITALPSWRIVDNGSLVLSSGLPAINTTDSTQSASKRITIPGIAGTARVDYFFVKETSDIAYATPGSATAGGSSIGWIATENSTSTFIFSNFGTPLLYSNGALVNSVNRGNIFTALNGRKLETTINASLSTWTDFTLCFYTSFDLNALIQEFVVYPTDQSSNRAAIETNINAHYAIY
jgi:hypothetical protein